MCFHASVRPAAPSGVYLSRPVWEYIFLKPGVLVKQFEAELPALWHSFTLPCVKVSSRHDTPRSRMDVIE